MRRREFLALSGLFALATGCEGGRTALARYGGLGIPERLLPADGDAVDPVHHLLNRAGFGPWPGQVDTVRELGTEAWVESQLDPDSLPDAGRWLYRRFESVETRPGEAFEYEEEVLREELARATVLRAAYSERQLYESMVAFWSDHLHISMDKGTALQFKPADDRAVIRAHALGTFRDLLRASALSPAMLIYLDGADNRRPTEDVAPNENYARELLELHTLGVHGGYTQADVMEAARALTGWTVRDAEAWRKGQVDFHREWHDDGEKVVLGEVIDAGGGEADLERLLDIVCAHPATARHLATKLCRWFIADAPPTDAVDAVAATYTDTHGDIRAMVRTALRHDSFGTFPGSKLKRPFRFVVSALRGLGATSDAPVELLAFLDRMGQRPFGHPTPDGYPQEPHPWLGTLFWRWRLAVELVRAPKPKAPPLAQLPVDALGAALGWSDDPDPAAPFGLLVGRAPTASERAALTPLTEDPRRLIAAILASPAFQVH